MARSEVNLRIAHPINRAVKTVCDIIIDATNLSRASRAKRLLGVPRSYERHALVFTPSREVIEQRLVERSDREPLPASALTAMMTNSNSLAGEFV